MGLSTHNREFKAQRELDKAEAELKLAEKNLENELNLDNSNLNNSQISDNKTNSNKRDYDKEPLFIKNHNPDVSSFRGFCFLVLVFISLFIVDIPTDRKIFNFFAAIILASRLATDPNKGKIIEFKMIK